MMVGLAGPGWNLSEEDKSLEDPSGNEVGEAGLMLWICQFRLSMHHLIVCLLFNSQVFRIAVARLMNSSRSEVFYMTYDIHLQ